jgi:hypothetical protein
MTDTHFALAAVRFGDGDAVDALLEAVVRTLQAQSRTIAGCLQRETPDGEDCCAIMHLEDVSSGEWTRFSQALGPGSKGCRLDPQALAEVSGRLIAEIGPQTDLIVLNRFGKGEADGDGFRNVIERASGLGVPVLTAVRQAFEPAWEDFTGGLGEILPADAALVVRWAAAAIEGRRVPLPAA